MRRYSKSIAQSEVADVVNNTMKKVLINLLKLNPTECDKCGNEEFIDKCEKAVDFLLIAIIPKAHVILSAYKDKLLLYQRSGKKTGHSMLE